MEAKDSLVKLVKAMLEIGAPMSRQALIDFLTGKENRQEEESRYSEMETFGCGDNHDEDYWNMVITAALKEGYMKNKTVKSENFIPTPAGKKFMRKPISFVIEEEDDIEGNISADSGIDELVKLAQSEKIRIETMASERTKQQIKLIQAIDRHIALDDYAESESIAFDDVLQELETLVKQGRKLDITYFTDEVIGEDCVEELVDFFVASKSDNLELAEKEFGDVYNEEEIRLARIVYRVRNLA